MSDLATLLQHNDYPGRVVGCARTADGEVTAFYALTGRSAASRDRSLRPTADGDLDVVSLSGAAHDALRHYLAVTSTDLWLVVGNGEQVSVIAQRLASELPPVVAADSLPYEPDPPLYTPRITVILDRTQPGHLVLARAGRPAGRRSGTDLMTLTVPDLAVGDAVLLTTYTTTGETVAPGRPYLEGSTEAADAADLLDKVWNSLPEARRVAAAVISVSTDAPKYLISQQNP